MKHTYWQRDRGEKFQTVGNASVKVKIYRRARGKAKARRWIFEVVDFTRGPGTRRLRGFGEYAAAHAEAKRIAEQLATGKATAAAMLGTEAATFGRAVELLRPTGASLELASATYAKAFEILGSDRIIEAASFFKQHGAAEITPRTVPEVVSELIESKRARDKSPRYLSDLRSRLGQFAKDFQTDIASISTPDVQHWLDELKVVPSTARGFRTLLFGMFRFAEARGYIFKGSNPVAGVEQISAKGDGDISIYTPTEVTALLLAASKEFRPVVAIGAFAGVRTAEIMRLTFPDIDLPGGYIHIAAAQAKTASRRLVPIAPNLAQWLAPYAKQRGLIWKGDRHEMEFARAETVKAAGVPWKPNALRHSFCSYRLAEVQSAAQVALEAGNSPAMVFRHYRELVKPEAAKTWFAVAPEQPANVVTLKTEAAI
jgi:integrase